jgi:peroxiredoxin
LRQEHARITEAGATTAAVFMGPPPGVGRYCRDREIPFACLADPDREAYRAFGVGLGGAREIIGPRVLTRGLKLFRRGVATGLPHPGQDFRQLGATLVIARGGTIRLAHYNRDASDNAPMEAVLGALGAS